MALDELLDEHEQGERVRNWLKENALGLLGGLALGLALIGGGKWWMQRQHQERVAIGETYDRMVRAIESGDLETAKQEAAPLADTSYAPLAALALAKGQLDAGDRDAAIATLRAARSDDPGLAAVIRQRLARLLVDAGQGEEAVSLLAGNDDPGALEVRGDAHFALGRADEARKDYEAALRKLDVAAPQRMLLELKLAQAGGTPDQAGTES
ncbi:tetratricopeptide repeat protein [Luteimonas sp. J29]|jgi:predicted negative regulator of RcsB-dependent stress response|uniref:YfgM family protein n=1 Tax=Luteimonas sp. J29 TaxID=935863 RepID=UPI0004795E29|nr:tetratricopeptide repeat protein [Luteimonas sp. J29]